MTVFADPKEWSIELPTAAVAQLNGQWRSLPYSHPGRQWDACLSRLCLDYLLPWIQSTYADVRLWLPQDDWPEIWEIVAGCALYIGDRRLILIPSDAIDPVLVVSQEWVDLPDWAGDYYLAIQIQTDPAGLRGWGYASHQTLKDRGDYDPIARTYSLSPDDLTQDMGSLTVIQQFCANVPRSVAPIVPVLPANLLDRLSNPSLLFPRLSIPFSTWGALVQDPDWRRQFYRQRQGYEATGPIVVRLGQWLDGLIETGWQPIDALLGLNARPQFRRLEPGATLANSWIRQAKIVTLQHNDHSISLGLEVAIVHLDPEDQLSVTLQIQVKLHPLSGTVLHPRVVLELNDLQPERCLQRVRSNDDDLYIQLNRFRANSGDSFQIRIYSDSDPSQARNSSMICETFSV